MSKKLISKNVPYTGVRAVITGSQSSTQTTWYSEGRGDRYYVNTVSSTASSVMESASFTSYLSFTMSGNVQQDFNIIPLSSGESVFIDTYIYAQNFNATKGYVERVFGAWRHTGTSIVQVGGTLSTTKFTDFSTVTTAWGVYGSQSVRLRCIGQTSEVIDWDLHIGYTKATHAILTATSSQTITPIYPSA